MLKVGDRVKVREGLENVTKRVVVKEDMVKLEGKEVEISWVGDIYIDGITLYGVKEDLGGWYWTEEMFEKIEEKESDNMKELTFREVIANIKEGEVWERVDDEYISNRIELKNGQLNQYNFWNGKMDFASKEAGLILDKTLYKLKRPQYTFQEAFKAFEEGKEIESCESGFKFKRYEDTVRIKGGCYKVLYECLKVKIFSIEEILGGWYIND